MHGLAIGTLHHTSTKRTMGGEGMVLAAADATGGGGMIWATMGWGGRDAKGPTVVVMAVLAASRDLGYVETEIAYADRLTVTTEIAARKWQRGVRGV